jgi:hypothetical protein
MYLLAPINSGRALFRQKGLLRWLLRPESDVAAIAVLQVVFNLILCLNRLLP